MESSMEVPQKIKNRTIVAIPLLVIYPKNMKTFIQKDMCTPMFNIYNSQNME